MRLGLRELCHVCAEEKAGGLRSTCDGEGDGGERILADRPLIYLGFKTRRELATTL